MNTDPFFHFSIQGTVLMPTNPPAALKPLVQQTYLTMFAEYRSTNPLVTYAGVLCSNQMVQTINVGSSNRFELEMATIYSYFNNGFTGTYASKVLGPPQSSRYSTVYSSQTNQTVLTCYISFLSEIDGSKNNVLAGQERISVIVPLNLSACIADIVARGYGSYTAQQLAAQSVPFSGTINGAPYSGQVALTNLRSSIDPIACWQFYDSAGAVFMAVETDTSPGPSVHFADDIRPATGQSTSSSGVSAFFTRGANPNATLTGTLKPFRILSKLLQPADQSTPPVMQCPVWANLAS